MFKVPSEISDKSVCEGSTSNRFTGGLRRELGSFKKGFRIRYLVLFIVVLYLTSSPIRRLTHYFHKTLPDYWPDEYVVPAALATVKVKNVSGVVETVSVTELLARIAPDHGMVFQEVLIQKDDFMNNCHGCIAKPFRLFDVGHSLLPDWTNQSFWSEYCMSAVFVYAICFAICFIFQRNPKITTISLLARAFRVVIPLHLMRSLFHGSTGLPGPGMHCQHPVVAGGGSAAYLSTKDDSIGSLLSTLFAINGNDACGDLIFSGHTMHVTIMLLLCVRYAPIAYPSPKFYWTWIVGASLLFVTQIFLILAARNHYTVDIVASCVLVFLVFNLEGLLFPTELLPTCADSATQDTQSVNEAEVRHQCV